MTTRRSTTPVQRVLMTPDQVTETYAFTRRQLKRWITEGRLSRVKPSGPTGPVYLRVAEIERLIEKTTIGPGKKAGRKPAKKTKVSRKA
jgi:hypothetical protein